MFLERGCDERPQGCRSLLGDDTVAEDAQLGVTRQAGDAYDVAVGQAQTVSGDHWGDDQPAGSEEVPKPPVSASQRRGWVTGANPPRDRPGEATRPQLTGGRKNPTASRPGLSKMSQRYGTLDTAATGTSTSRCRALRSHPERLRFHPPGLLLASRMSRSRSARCAYRPHAT